MNWEEIKKWDYIVVAVSSEYHKKYDMVELDDIKQSLYQWFVEHPNKLKDYFLPHNRRKSRLQSLKTAFKSITGSAILLSIVLVVNLF